MRDLVLVPGPTADARVTLSLREEWLDALTRGLAMSGLDLPIEPSRVRLPDYGVLNDWPADQRAEVVAERLVQEVTRVPTLGWCIEEILDSVMTRFGLTEEQVEEEAEHAVRLRGLATEAPEPSSQNWGWIAGILRTIDQQVPWASGGAIGLATSNLAGYLCDLGRREHLRTCVADAIDSEGEAVVVAHSLGTVAAYDCLRALGANGALRVSLLVTLGSPLSLRVVRQALQPNRHPRCVSKWLNVCDPNDAVALYPLEARHFPGEASIENNTEVDNRSENRHGIHGYLSDPTVARRIHDALVAE